MKQSGKKAFIERNFDLVKKGEAIDRVQTRLWLPTQHGKDWTCRFSFKSKTFSESRGMFGIDGFQALDATIILLDVLLQKVQRDTGGKLKYLGIPYTKPYSLIFSKADLLTGIKKQEKHDKYLQWIFSFISF